MAFLDVSKDGAPREATGASLVEFPKAAQRPARRPALAFSPNQFTELDVRVDEAQATLWWMMRPAEAPSFTPALLRDLSSLRRILRAYASEPNAAPLRYIVGGSAVPGIFNLGGDLSRFVRYIREKDRESLRAYAYECCELVHALASGVDQAISIGLVQGDALGGGFETALGFQVLVAERSAKMGLPEVLFNLFPGMGAYSLLARKIGMAQAERMILSGRIYSAAELYELGVVDILAEDGRGEAEVRKIIDAPPAKYRMRHAISRAAQRVAPVTLRELTDITDMWVEVALQLEESDLRRMERLAGAQKRRVERL